MFRIFIFFTIIFLYNHYAYAYKSYSDKDGYTLHHYHFSLEKALKILEDPNANLERWISRLENVNNNVTRAIKSQQRKLDIYKERKREEESWVVKRQKELEEAKTFLKKREGYLQKAIEEGVTSEKIAYNQRKVDFAKDWVEKIEGYLARSQKSVRGYTSTIEVKTASIEDDKNYIKGLQNIIRRAKDRLAGVTPVQSPSQKVTTTPKPVQSPSQKVTTTPKPVQSPSQKVVAPPKPVQQSPSKVVAPPRPVQSPSQQVAVPQPIQSSNLQGPAVFGSGGGGSQKSSPGSNRSPGSQGSSVGDRSSQTDTTDVKKESNCKKDTSVYKFAFTDNYKEFHKAITIDEEQFYISGDILIPIKNWGVDGSKIILTIKKTDIFNLVETKMVFDGGNEQALRYIKGKEVSGEEVFHWFQNHFALFDFEDRNNCEMESLVSAISTDKPSHSSRNQDSGVVK